MVSGTIISRYACSKTRTRYQITKPNKLTMKLHPGDNLDRVLSEIQQSERAKATSVWIYCLLLIDRHHEQTNESRRVPSISSSSMIWSAWLTSSNFAFVRRRLNQFRTYHAYITRKKTRSKTHHSTVNLISQNQKHTRLVYTLSSLQPMICENEALSAEETYGFFKNDASSMATCSSVKTHLSICPFTKSVNTWQKGNQVDTNENVPAAQGRSKHQTKTRKHVS